MPDVIVNKNGVFIDTHVRYRTISDNLSKQEYKFLLTTTLTISDTAWAKFKLDGQYDTFAANIVTSEDTNRDANMSVEIYLDDVLVGRVDDVVRDEHIRPISVSVNGGNVLMIKVIRTNSRYDSHAYICDTTLSVLQ